VIKKLRIPREVESDRKKCVEWATRLIKDKLCVDAKVVGCRESGAVVVIRLENEEEKKEVMQNKFRLKGESIFIENDLSWEDRNVQVRINRWVKEQKGKGLEVKIGVGRVRVKGIWRTWADIEREGLDGEKMREEEGRRNEAEGLGEDEGEGKGKTKFFKSQEGE